MEKRFLNIVPECDKCKGELVLSKIQVDIPNACYILDCECIMCGEEVILILALTDFIEINQLINPPEGGRKNYETPNNN